MTNIGYNLMFAVCWNAEVVGSRGEQPFVHCMLVGRAEGGQSWSQKWQPLVSLLSKASARIEGTDGFCRRFAETADCMKH